MIWKRGSVSTALPQLFEFNEAASLPLHTLGEWPPWRVFKNFSVAGNRVPAISLESLCVPFSEEICSFYMLMVLKLVICSVFLGKEGHCVNSYLLLFALNIQNTLSSSAMQCCLFFTCLKSQGSVLSKSIPILKDRSLNSVCKAPSEGMFPDRQ